MTDAQMTATKKRFDVDNYSMSHPLDTVVADAIHLTRELERQTGQ